jgi:hypothetical protein
MVGLPPQTQNADPCLKGSAHSPAVSLPKQVQIRARGASGQVARGGQVTSSGSQPNVYRRPARTFVLPVPRVPGGLTILLLSEEGRWTHKAPQTSCRTTAS